ncbi:MAG: ABC transporter ATPase [Bacteroidia bacterium]
MNLVKEIAPDAQIWIYQNSREFSESEVSEIQKKLFVFINEWAAHGQKLTAAAEIFHRRFIVLCADKNEAIPSGCSIDTSVHFIQQLEKEFQISLLDRTTIVYEKSGKLNSFKISQFEQMLATKEVDEDTIIFNNTINTKSDLENNWKIPVKDSWLQAIL